MIEAELGHDPWEWFDPEIGRQRVRHPPIDLSNYLFHRSDDADEQRRRVWRPGAQE